MAYVLSKKGVTEMIILFKYEEFGPGMGYPSIRNHLMNEPYEEKEKIIEYMKKGHVHMVNGSRMKDVFTGEPIKGEMLFMDDGKYSWTSKLIYYVDKYNLELPEDFIDHILNQQDL